MNSRWRPILIVAGIGLAWFILGPLLGVCNQQVQTGMLLLAAVVAAWMANAAQRSAEATKQMVKLTCAPELVAWLVWYPRNQEPLVCVCRVHNYLKGAAVNVRLLPLWHVGTEAEEKKRDVVLEEGEIPRDFKPDEWPRINRPARALVIAGEKFAEMAVTRPPSEADEKVGVLCVRWDDPANRVRRWSCWRHDPVDDRHQRVRLRGPEKGTGCDDCSERRHDDNKCPHELGDEYAHTMYDNID